MYMYGELTHTHNTTTWSVDILFDFLFFFLVWSDNTT